MQFETFMDPHFSDTTSQFQLTNQFPQILMEVGVFTAGGYKFLCRSRNAENMNSNGHSLTDDAPQQKCKTNAKYVFSSLPLWLLSSEWAGVWDQWHHYWWIPHIVSPDSNISVFQYFSFSYFRRRMVEFLTLWHSLSASCLWSKGGVLGFPTLGFDRLWGTLANWKNLFMQLLESKRTFLYYSDSSINLNSSISRMSIKPSRLNMSG